MANLGMWVQLYQRNMRLISMRRFPVSGNKDSCLGSVFRPFTVSDQYSVQTLMSDGYFHIFLAK